MHKIKNPKSEILNSKQIQNPNYQNSKQFRKFRFWVLSLFRVSCLGFRVLFLTFLFTFFSNGGFCDTLLLRKIPEGKDGNEVEILEEKEDSFTVKIPKEEIEMIKRKRPTEMKLWQEKKILWEDNGDYLTIYLPKEKIVAPQGTAGDVAGATQVLKNQLPYAGGQGSPSEAAFWKGAGRVTGRILKGGLPLAGVKLKISYVSSPAGELSRIFGPGGEKSKPGNFVFETVNNELGRYEFKNVPLGEYDIYWLVPGAQSWYRRLSEKPDIAVRPGEILEFKDIDTRPSRKEQ